MTLIFPKLPGSLMNDVGNAEQSGPMNQGARDTQLPDLLSSLRVAIVHYWFVTFRGGERVVEVLADTFPQADIFAMVLDPKALPPLLRSRKFTTSFLQKVPGIRRHYKKFLPLFPLALEQFKLDDYDLVISSESGPAKGVLTGPHTCHICYCHTPMRYVWDMYHQYRAKKGMGIVSRSVFHLAAHYMRMWDLAAAARVDYFVANSQNVAARIFKHYRRRATVIHPPVMVSAGYISSQVEDYYLLVSQLVNYKRVDVAIDACNRLRRPLRIIGEGEEYARLRGLAGPTVKFLGHLPDQELRENYARCRALLFPGEEDFGIVPVEAQSFGRPVIAFGRGGALETVVGGFPGDCYAPESSTGVFFAEQSGEFLAQAIRFFESNECRFSPTFIRRHAERFDESRFKAEMRAFINAKMVEFKNMHL
jgi:glycosyltransferase involved in cell wall biosynthesis